MKVVYQTLTLLLFFSCASSPYRIAHEHLERNPSYMKIGVWPAGSYWVELYDDLKTTYPFDEAVWMNTRAGQPDNVDIVCDKGDIHRYGWHYSEKKFKELYILKVKDGRNMTPFQYYDSIVNQGRVPI